MPNTGLDEVVHVVAGLVRHPRNSAKFLITQRKKGQHLEDFWEFPGGKIETAESRFKALQRELDEEIGIQVISALPYQSVLHRYPDKHILLDVWEVTGYRGKVRGLEGQSTRWLTLDNVDRYEFPDADLPVLTALNLPQKLLITPDMPEQHEDAFIAQFESLMSAHPYPLVQFRSHHLSDKNYARVAERLRAVCEPYRADVIINRSTLKSLQSRIFKKFKRRHLNSLVLQALPENSFSEEIILSASCHDELELRKAQQLGCQFALLSMVRDTPSHPGRHGKGWFRIKQIISKTSLPVYALGGVNRRDFCAARFQGAIGVAGITDFWTI